MDALFPLNIFPEGSLASSVITTVWVSVFVVAFFNLRFGWVMSGLVVPGYLVPILIVKPWSAALIAGEAVLTYLLVYAFSERASRLGYWSSLFGRDRFLVIVLVSVFVRIGVDAALIPAVDGALQARGLVGIDLRNDLQSFGLIIIALMANQLAKPGLARGLLSLGCIVAVSYLLIRFVLMEFTNFSISNLGYMYEDAAQSILASPKSYIILLTAAFLASRFNLIYGWDFNGILLPALLALQWYQPSKILLTFVEAYVILLLARALMATPIFANVNLEGARRILLLFNISFAYRLVLGYVLPVVAPDLKVSDAYGFGYLLSTLLAMKMFDKGVAIHMTRATLQASGTAVLAATTLGFAIKLLNQPSADAVYAEPGSALAPQRMDTPLAQTLRNDKVLYYRARAQAQMPRPYPAEIETFRRAVALLAAAPADAPDPALRQATALLAELRYTLIRADNDLVYLREMPPERGWGAYVMQLGSASRLAIEWPRANDDRVGPDVALALMTVLQAGSLALATAPARINADGSADVALTRQTLFHAFRQGLDRGQVLQVRLRGPESAGPTADLRPQLWVKRRLPQDLDLSILERLFPGLIPEWGAPRLRNIARDDANDQFAELLIPAGALRRVLALSLDTPARTARLSTHSRIDGYLADWLFSDATRFAGRGSEAHQQPSLEELLFLEAELIAPLLRRAPFLLGAEDAVLDQLNAAARVVGYDLIHLTQLTTQEQFLLLAESPQARHRYWGLLVVRLGPGKPSLLQAPYPQSEVGSGEFAVKLLQQTQARALFVSTAHRRANQDGSADPLLSVNASLLSLVNQVFLKQHRAFSSHIIQVRGYAKDQTSAPISDDVLLVSDRAPPGRQAQKLGDDLSALGLQIGTAHDSATSATYSVGPNAQARQAGLFPLAEFSLLMLSPESRLAFRRYALNQVDLSHFETLGIAAQHSDLASFIQSYQPRLRTRPLPADLRQELARYQRQPDIVSLYRLQQQWPRYRYLRVVDPSTLQSFIAVEDEERYLAGLWNLNPLRQGTQWRIPSAAVSTDKLDQFMNTGAAWLVFAPAR